MVHPLGAKCGKKGLGEPARPHLPGPSCLGLSSSPRGDEGITWKHSTAEVKFASARTRETVPEPLSQDFQSEQSRLSYPLPRGTTPAGEEPLPGESGDETERGSPQGATACRSPDNLTPGG